MMRSMFSGVSSLRVHQTRMDVIANNIANVNTVGFKSQRATFSDAFYQRIQGASAPDPITGRTGVNPQQIGLGLNLASIDNIMTQGATQRTDNAMDVMLTGQGFLIVQDAGGQFFTRAGNIGRDFQNNLHINGMQLMGWSTVVDEATGRHVVDRSTLVPLSLGGAKQNMPAEPTTIVSFAGNLNVTQLTRFSTEPLVEGVIRTKTIFDSLGNRYTIDVRFVYHRGASEAANSPHSYWTMELITQEFDSETGLLATAGTPDANRISAVAGFLENDRDRPVAIGMCLFGANGISGGLLDSNGFANQMVTSATIAFNSRGEMVGMGPTMAWDRGTQNADGSWPLGTHDRADANFITFNDQRIPLPRTFNAGTTAAAGTVHENTNIPRAVERGSVFSTVRIVPIRGVAPAATFGSPPAVSGVSVYAPPGGAADAPGQGTVVTSIGNFTFNMSEMFQRGGENTTLRALTMDGNGPGTLQDISIGGDGTIVGRFSNGRTRVLGQIPLAFFQNPEGLERVGGNLWVPTANSGAFDGVGLIGTMQGGALEMSNVDLANEFTEMITTQRGFQAASRTITVSDEMLQELVNLRR